MVRKKADPRHTVIRRERYSSKGALTRKTLDLAHDYLELQRIRVEVEKAEIELNKRRKADQRRNGQKH